MRFFRSPGGASPKSRVIADAVSCWSLGLAFPRIDFRTPRRIPPTCSSTLCSIFGFASPRSLPPRTFISFRSATVAMKPFPASPFLPYRRDVVPRGVAPQAGPYHRASYEDVRWPTLPGPCSPSKLPSCRFLRSDRASMMPCITVAPRLHTVAAAFAPSLVSRPFDRVGEARSVPCPVPVRSRPISRESDVFLVGLHHLAMMPRRLVAVPSRPSMLPSSFTSVPQRSTRFRSRERTVVPHSSCGVLSDTIGCVHREVVARSQLRRRGDVMSFARVSLRRFLAVSGK